MNTAQYLTSLERRIDSERRMKQFDLNWKRILAAGAFTAPAPSSPHSPSPPPPRCDWTAESHLTSPPRVARRRDMNWKCFFGIHDWAATRPLNVYDAFPSPFDRNYKNPKRECQRCGKRQYWLPGYGGSEIGSWEPLREDQP